MSQEKMVESKPVVYQAWWESERGWGERPNGYSLHLSVEDCEQFIKEYWDSMPNYVPDEYSRPYGDPKVRMVIERIYLQLIELKAKGKNGFRSYDRFLKEE